MKKFRSKHGTTPGPKFSLLAESAVFDVARQDAGEDVGPVLGDMETETRSARRAWRARRRFLGLRGEPHCGARAVSVARVCAVRRVV